MTPGDLLQRLDAIGAELARRGDAIALLGQGSVGTDLHRLDEHSDLDFFVIVDDGAKQRYLDSIDWLEAPCPVVYSFRNSVDGRKALYADWIFCEYAVFTYDELVRGTYPEPRIVWQRADAPAGLDVGRLHPPPAAYRTADYQANEALTNLFIGLHREIRGEQLAAFRLIQVHAVDRLIMLLGLLDADVRPQQDPFAPERGVERRFATGALPLREIVVGYERNREAALAALAFLEAHVDVDETLAAEVRRLAAG
jgi:hypothetical protein